MLPAAAAHVVYKMTVLRNLCLSLPHGSHIAVHNVQHIVQPDAQLISLKEYCSVLLMITK
jgi:hypothetical protein